MVSSIQSIRLMTTQIALKALKEQEETTTSTSSASSSLLQQYGLDTSSSSSNDTLTRLLTTLATKNPDSTVNTTPNTTPTPVSTDVTTASFMRSLKDSLEEMADTAAGKKQADAMLAALKAGTLTVTDPVSGQKIAAWDVDDEKHKDTTSGAATTIATNNWSDFLKERLTRGEDVSYAKSSDGSYIDKTTGENAYFGTVGSKYYYLSWPDANANTPASGTDKTVSSSGSSDTN
ncbi:hypothetical protein M2418_001092 [Rhizobium sp. BIGb0125]|uniref:hypothetical protein n=1 Tax=Rhizobium sp. BIGb0125 TaxID=2940618 RepID=UPI002169B890|nr:hypothetical protein [Rhizobium sp. BIGb0125]MCS4241581.1 hypothetical protein [Rhizobium sp. BIGb0125]